MSVLKSVDYAAFEAAQKRAGRGMSPLALDIVAAIKSLAPRQAFAVEIEATDKPNSVRAMIVRLSGALDRSEPNADGSTVAAPYTNPKHAGRAVSIRRTTGAWLVALA